jgi:hypothetical protein
VHAAAATDGAGADARGTRCSTRLVPARCAFSNSAWFAFMRILVAIAFILIIGSLASALIFLMKDKGKSNRTVKALAFRVGFSITLFVLLLIANQLGWIEPTGIR